MVKVLVVVDAPHWSCMTVARQIQKHSKHDVSIAFWWYKTPHHSYEFDDFDINYIHSGALLTVERWADIRDKAQHSDTKWILGFRGATAGRRLDSKVVHPLWGAVSCSNQALIDHCAKIAPHQHYFYCPSGVDTSHFPYLDHYPSEFRILWAGTPHAGVKRFDHMEKLAALFPFKFAGSNRKTDPWHGLVKAYKYNDMPDFYSQGSVYISTSEKEGSPLPPQEAAAMGRPVLAYRAGDLDVWMPKLISHEDWRGTPLYDLKDDFFFDNWRQMVPVIKFFQKNPLAVHSIGKLFSRAAYKRDYKHTVKHYDIMFDKVMEES